VTAAAQTAWARCLLRGLRDAGVTDLVVSPGSRSTPFLAAALAEELRCHPVIDERAAGFFALGMARATNQPVALLCTSGTAAAHYYPAVIEAATSHTPLIVLTADRPPELHHCAAPQTIDQLHLYSAHAHFIDLGPPDDSDLALRALRRKAHQAVTLAHTHPVHLNCPARKPLEPDLAPTTPPPHHPSTPHPFPPPTLHASAAAIAALAAACTSTTRGLIVAGPAPLAHRALRPLATRLAAITGFPLLAEATSQLRLCPPTAAPRCDAFDLLYRATPAARTPDLVIQLGQPPTSAALGALFAAHRPPRWVITDHGWPDPWSDAAAIVTGDPADTLGRLIDALASLRRPSTAWADHLAAADRLAWSCAERELGKLPLPPEGGGPGRGVPPMHEGQAVRAAVAALPPGALLALGNSLPVRLVDTWCPAATAVVDVLSQRGASGIDGLIAGAAGSAAAAARPTALLLGDVSFAHDLSALAIARHSPAPLALIVLDNAGGRIFERLPVAASAPLAAHLERFWLTPPAIDMAAAAAAYGVPAVTADTPATLAAAVAAALARPGCTVIRAPIDPTPTADHRLLAATRAALADLEEP
jgi:2-succinyl-5-enolpyruvyl-6-hydroxy-3-cyclohexene-1-carboxylate synthase